MPAIPPEPMQLTAELVRSDDAQRIKVYMDGWMRRIETQDQTGRTSIVISRPDKGVIWSLSPQTKTFSQARLPKYLKRVFDPRALCDWTEDGAEVIDGRRCRRFVGHYLDESSPVGGAYEVCFIDAKTGVHRRVVTYNTNGNLVLTIDCLNAVVGPPPRAAFEMPVGYKRTYHQRRRVDG
jgi:hypothetical protein